MMAQRSSPALLLAMLVALRACGGDGEPGTPPVTATDSVGLREIAAGLSFPLYVTAPAGDPRLFVVEKTGTIRIVQAGTLVARPFLDLSGLVSSGGEQGLLGLAFDPAYATSGRFYVDYTDRNGDTRIARYRVSGDAGVADPASGEIILTVPQPYSNHNGGQLAFGPDGFLYIGMGDGGSGGDPQGHGQNANDLLGSLLRLDVSGATGYTSPAGNPYAGGGGRPEVFSIGLRNPWRFSFDRAGGDLYIADVGQNEREEVDVSTAASGGGRGLNYGWNRMEGTACYQSGCTRGGLTLPVTEYTHADGCSITGGYVYRGQALPALAGTYFYGDFCSGWVRSFRYAGGRATDPREWPMLKPGGQITSFGEDAAGELYLTVAEGKVFKVVAR
ncbi:MAG TPA: PQQ-dependent sugar dehydrogenase [Gemmatimonadales bacterium]|jgi:glucose/arabinose dehydrogenase|nr:PQQ-dependent sugar dehydrogenase [Gemmatimonadales bacterium]